MAEEEKNEAEQDAAAEQEAKELEQMLGAAEAEEVAAGGITGKVLRLFKAITPKDKKTWIIASAGAFVLLLAVAGGVVYFFLDSPEQDENALIPEDIVPAPDAEKDEDSFIFKTAIYTLDPFFMPLKVGTQQMERFVNIRVNLLLSNRRMEKDMEKNLRPLRQNIYRILKKKKTTDYTINRAKLKNRLKQEIVTLANSLLLSGTGTVDDVFITQFVVK